MTERWKIDEHEVDIRRRPRQRSLRLRVLSDGSLRVTCAKTVPRREIFAFVRESEAFLKAQLEQLKLLRQTFPPKTFADGETLPFLGDERTLVLRAKETRPKVVMENRVLILLGENLEFEERRNAVQRFFRRAGKHYLEHRVQFFSQRMGLRPRELSFRSQTSRWGSCSENGHISLNWRLIAAPSEVVDYVIVHELAHLRHLNHGSEFWKLVKQFSPAYKEKKAWLRQNQMSFDFLAKHYRKIS